MIDQNELQEVENVKLLGVFIDSSLHFRGKNKLLM